jgi:hypothetical protein
MRNSKLQSAMEYLMTYGWAILIIAVVLGVLFQLGVFNSSSFSVRAPPGVCQVLRTSAAVNLVGQCSGILPQYVSKINGGSTAGTTIPLVLATSFSYSLWLSYLGPSTVTQWPVPFGNNPHVWTGFRGDSYGAVVYFEYGKYPTCDGVSGHFTSIGPSQSLSDKKWHNLAVTYNGFLLSFYFDGSLVGIASQTGLCAGLTSYNIGGYLNGTLANAQIYNSSLAANDIVALYSEGIGGAPIYLQNLVGWWPLNGDAKDYSGYNNNGAPTGVSYVSQYGK